MKTQYDKLSYLLTRPGGCTAVDVMRLIPSTCPHKRVSDMQARGWSINKRKDGKLIRYTGKPPKVKARSIFPVTWPTDTAVPGTMVPLWIENSPCGTVLRESLLV